jgi:hypothetical protein
MQLSIYYLVIIEAGFWQGGAGRLSSEAKARLTAAFTLGLKPQPPKEEEDETGNGADVGAAVLRPSADGVPG